MQRCGTVHHYRDTMTGRLSKRRALEVLDYLRKDVASLTELFFEAAMTEKRLPGHRRGSVQACWPDTPADKQGYGYTETQVRLAKATSAQVDRYDLAIEITCLLDLEERRLVWAVAHSSVRRARGPAWRKLGKMLGIHADTVKKRFTGAMIELWYRLLDQSAE